MGFLSPLKCSQIEKLGFNQILLTKENISNTLRQKRAQLSSPQFTCSQTKKTFKSQQTLIHQMTSAIFSPSTVSRKAKKQSSNLSDQNMILSFLCLFTIQFSIIIRIFPMVAFFKKKLPSLQNQCSVGATDVVGVTQNLHRSTT